jgi:hypothetical protein
MKQLLFIGFLIISATVSGQVTIRVTEAISTGPADSVKKSDTRSVIKPYEKVITPAFTSNRGLFTVHQHGDTVYFEIPDSLLGRDIEVINRLVKGPGGTSAYSGEQLGEKTISFEKRKADSTIRICYKYYLAEADKNNAIGQAVVNSYHNPVAISFPIKAYGKGNKSYVIDISQYLLSSTSLFNAIGAGSKLATAVDSKYFKDFFLESSHAYPINVEMITSKNGYSKGIAQSGIAPGDPVTVFMQTSFILLPEVPMQRRYFDQRVGYFDDYMYHFTDNQQKVENYTFINRWRLEPAEADLEKYKRGELVEPKKPIIIYIDPATPKQWRPWLIAGINDWQKAFEQAGFKNAIQGREWPEGDSLQKDDARFSMLCYLPSPTANAYGPNVHDPRTGEIIQTHIGWYHNVMTLLNDWYFIQAAAVDPQARKPVFDEQLMGQLIRFVSSHEVGHTLGLRHNFGNSSQTPVDSLRSKTWLAKHGHTASIMDYARFNYVAQPEDEIPAQYLFPRIGEYDQWAIEWGYSYKPNISYEEDKKMMRQLIVDRTSKNPRLWFGDGETRQSDVRCLTEDLGDNAMKANSYGIKNLQRIMQHLPEWTHEEGGLYENMDLKYAQLKKQYTRYINQVVANIGGLYITDKSEEQSGQIIEPVPVNRQREALRFLDKQLFTTPYWLLDEKVTGKLIAPDGPDFVEDLQVKALNTLLDMEKINKILANERQFKDHALSLEEYISTVHKYIWRELPGGQAIDPYHRSLQKSYIGCLQDIVLSTDPAVAETDASAFLRQNMVELQQQIGSALPKVRDNMTRYHLKDLQVRIKKVLEAEPK